MHFELCMRNLVMSFLNVSNREANICTQKQVIYSSNKNKKKSYVRKDISRPEILFIYIYIYILLRHGDVTFLVPDTCIVDAANF